MSNKFLGVAPLAAVLLGAAPALAADTEAMTSTALILKPLTLTKLSDLSFGDIVPSGTGDWVAIDAGTGARTTDKAVLLPANPGQRAEFASSGINNTLVFLELSLPPYADLTNGSGDNLKLNNLTLDGSALRVLTPLSQVFFVGIGGEVYIRPDQEEGVYTGTFTLTATYL